MTGRCFFIGMSWNASPNSSHFRALAGELVARGHRAVLLVDRQRSEVEDHTGNPAVYSWPSPRPTRWRDAIFLLRLVARHRPDCLISNFGSVNLMTLVGWLTRVPCRVVWRRTLSTQIDLDTRAPHWRVELLRLRKRFVYALSTHLVSNSLATLEDLTRVFHVAPGKCRVFVNSLADPLTQPGVQRATTERARLVVCAGRLYPAKGQDVMIRAAALLAHEFPDCEVQLIGDGPERARFMALVRTLHLERTCTFTGSLPHDEVLRRMASAVATVVPSRSEAFGLVNIESLAVGTPVVASRVGGITEIVRDGVDGFLVPPEEPEALAAQLGRLLREPGLSQRMGLAARLAFVGRFEQAGVVRQQADWFEEIVTARTRVAPSFNAQGATS